MDQLEKIKVRTTFPEKRRENDDRIFTLDHYYIGLAWWTRHGHFNESLYRKLVATKQANEIRN